jgi:hypothetical protein
LKDIADSCQWSAVSRGLSHLNKVLECSRRLLVVVSKQVAHSLKIRLV